MRARVSTSCSPERRCARPALAATHGSSESTEARWRFVLSSHGGRGVCDGTSCLLLSPALSHTQYTGRARAQKHVRATRSNRFWLHFFFRRLSALPPLLTRIAVASLRVQCDGNARWEYDLQPLLTLLSQSRTHHLRGEWAAYALERSCYLTPGLQLQAPSNHSRGRHCPAAGIPREARARHAASSPPTARAVAARARAASPRSCAPCGSSTASRRESWLSPEINRRNLNPDFKTRVHGTHGDTRARRGAHGEAAVGLHIQEHGDHRIPAPQSCDPAACSSAPAWAWLAEPQRTVYIVPWTDEES